MKVWIIHNVSGTPVLPRTAYPSLGAAVNGLLDGNQRMAKRLVLEPIHGDIPEAYEATFDGENPRRILAYNMADETGEGPF